MREPADFDAFYDATSRRVLHQLYALTGDLGRARDCTQEAYARAWRQWAAVSAATSPEAWVRGTAWRLASRRWRGGPGGRARWSTAPPGTGSADLVAALLRLPERQRYAVVVRYLAGAAVAEIAAETGTSAATVENRLAKACATLARILPGDIAVLTGGHRV
ncbi:sigma factor-like helix-turn-helix DNA-binding protein [Jiangella rhizosphaerae]|uniref:SigE family RNA polymerase sigma factor n=1 Tax=Jiangella rhizosphaerae TaxID=2293569 RepID=A0A418KS51_9ACTN|nr:sigma factor-like helix-turn-helix DNA-binding protein [Jiangella rhizosphaerae]RIQ27102.1 SigE family RNA polymerase sigma factor [Jiangella rhizosphaerae]